MIGSLPHRELSLVRGLQLAAAAALFVGYVAVATFATLFVPLMIVIFVAPFAAIAILAAPEGRAAPKSVIMPLLLAGAFLMPLWPTYINLHFGPMPILTPPRIIFYAVTSFWLYDMTFSRLRRAQFLVAIKQSAFVGKLVVLLFVLNFASIPLAHGSVLAGQEFVRQIIIWFLPFCAFATYCRRIADFHRLLTAMILGAALLGGLAIAEVASGTLVANVLSPLISGDAEWLRITQEMKIRDGLFRAQATHTHPLSLGEFLAVCAPLALGFALAARAKTRLLWVGGLGLIIAGVVATNSRGALLGLTSGLAVIGAVMALRFLKSSVAQRFRPAIGFAAIAMIAVSPVFAFGAHKMISGDAGTSAARSSQSRIDQINMAWPLIVKRPVLGHGTGRAAIIIGFWGRSLTVDNYYLTLAVDLGLPGPVVFISILIFAIRSSLSGATRSPPKYYWMLIGVAGAMAAFAISRSVVSQTPNLSTFYIILGAYTGVAASALRNPRRNGSLIKGDP